MNLLTFVNDAPMYVCINANGWLGSSISKHVGSLSADQETPNGERLHRFLVGADLCAVNTVICEGDVATWVPTRRRPRRIDFVAVSLSEMLRVKKCWIASELDVATVRDDHYPVVVDFETIVSLPKAGNRQRKATKLCALRLRNQVCREAFQKDLEGFQGGTPCKHVDEHHAVCFRAIQDLARRHFESQKQGPRKHWISLRTWTFMDCVKVLRRLMRMVCERLKREEQRAALVRWRGVPSQMRERPVAAARGREAQLGLAFQVFGARVKIADRREKRTYLQENLDRAAGAADNGNEDEV